MKREEYPETLTVQDVKKFMNIGVNQAYELVRSRADFPKFYIGRSPRIPRDAFFEWYDQAWQNHEKLVTNCS